MCKVKTRPDFSFQILWQALIGSALRGTVGSTLLFLIVLVTASAATPEDEARATIDRFNTAMKLKDAEAISHLLASDCIILMTEPGVGLKSARLFSRDSFLKALKARYAQATASTYSGTIHSVSTSDSGDVFVMAESDVRARVDEHSEWFRSHEYILMRPVGEHMMIRLVVAELVFYFPDVPREPERENK
jgi:ketosteroid isomerase-like protein